MSIYIYIYAYDIRAVYGEPHETFFGLALSLFTLACFVFSV